MYRITVFGWISFFSRETRGFPLDPSLSNQTEAAPLDFDIHVIGKKKERESERSTGHSVVIKPSEATRFDSLTHLKKESSLLPVETGKISPSGFTLPKVRGQDLQLTEVYMEGILLQDPYFGLPLVDDMDLRAFGSLEIHQGLSPYSVASLNPISSILYRLPRNDSSNAKIGIQTGKPYGWSEWGQASYHEKDSPIFARIFLRKHSTDGKFSYYSDEGTPYNTEDDRMRTRENNDQSFLQAIPYLSYADEDNTIKILGMGYQYNRGLPSLSPLIPSLSREKGSGYLLFSEYQRHLKFFTLGLSLSQNQDEREVTDPHRRFLATAEESHLDILSPKLRSFLQWDALLWKGHLLFEEGNFAIKQTLEGNTFVDTTRRNQLFYAGLLFTPHPLFSFELKGSLRQHQDKTKLQTQDEEPDLSKHQVQSQGASIALHPTNYSNFYFQQALTKRPPSLLEEFGNGAALHGNPGLQSEAIRHQEIGIGVEFPWILQEINLTGYKDMTQEKIFFIPILVNASKAMNLRETEVTGWDLQLTSSWKKTKFWLSFTQLFPYDLSRVEKKILPQIPERVFVMELSQNFLEAFTFRILRRYRSEVYKDLANSIIFPEATVYDTSLDYSRGNLQIGFSLLNTLNLTSQTVRAVDDENNRGRTGFSEITGAPLPGRHWQLSISLTH